MTTRTIGQLADAAGVHVETVRFYERRGLLPEPPRRSSGYRTYPPESLARLRFIKGAQTLGFTLDEIKHLLALRVQPGTNCEQVRQQAEQKLDEVDAKLRALQQLRHALSMLVDACVQGGPAGDCPILEAIEESSFRGNNHVA